MGRDVRVGSSPTFGRCIDAGPPSGGRASLDAPEGPLEPTPELRFAARTDTGRKREHNEDNFLVDRRMRLFIVCDGLGGHHGGEIASAMAVNVTREHLRDHRTVLDRHASAASERPEVLALLREAVTVANTRVHERGRLATSGRAMGTTLSLLLLLGGRAYVAHVGDTRIYRFRGGALDQLTTDHSLFHEVQQGLHALAENQSALAAAATRNQITRAVGVHPEVEVDVASFELRPRDRFLLASDGLHGPVDDRTLAACLEPSDPDPIVTRLVDLANAAGGPDNITAIIVDAPETLETDLPAAAAVAREGLLAARALDLFRPLSDPELSRLLELGTRAHALPGERIVAPGEALAGPMLLVSGELRAALPASAARANEPFAPVRAPAFLFEDALLTDRAAPLTVTGGPGGAVIIRLPRDATLSGPLREPTLFLKVARAIALNLSRRLEEAAASLDSPAALVADLTSSTRPLSRPPGHAVPPALPSDAPRTGRSLARPSVSPPALPPAGVGATSPSRPGNAGLAGGASEARPAVSSSALPSVTSRAYAAATGLPPTMASAASDALRRGGEPSARPSETAAIASQQLRKTVPGLPSSRTVSYPVLTSFGSREQLNPAPADDDTEQPA